MNNLLTIKPDLDKSRIYLQAANSFNISRIYISVAFDLSNNFLEEINEMADASLFDLTYFAEEANLGFQNVFWHVPFWLESQERKIRVINNKKAPAAQVNAIESQLINVYYPLLFQHQEKILEAYRRMLGLKILPKLHNQKTYLEMAQNIVREECFKGDQTKASS